jgi:hypothetical protein
MQAFSFCGLRGTGGALTKRKHRQSNASSPFNLTSLRTETKAKTSPNFEQNAPQVPRENSANLYHPEIA